MAAADRGIGWFCVFLNFVLCCVILIGLVRANANCNGIQWSQRHFKPLRVGLIISFLVVLLGCNFLVLVKFLELFEIDDAFVWPVVNVGLVSFMALYVLRAWVCHYDYHAGLALFLSVTNLDIDEDDVEDYRWFINNKQAYGSPNYLYKFTAFFILAVNVVLFAWDEVSPTTFEFALISVYVIMIVVSISITRKLSLLDDNFFIRRELLAEFRILASFFLISGILIIFGRVLTWKVTTLILTELTAIVICLMACYSTFWVLKQSKINGMPDASSDPNKEDATTKMNIVSNAPPISTLFSSPEATAEFIKHLVRELSVENIFFLSDVMNFKQQFVDQGFLERVEGFTCQVPKSLAKVNYNMDSFKKYGMDISEMYVDGMSIFVLTSVTEDTRDECVDFWDELEDVDDDKVDFNKLAHSFDKVADQIYLVIKDAYIRFSKTPEFQNVDLAENRMGRAMSAELVGVLANRSAGGTAGQ